MFKVSAQLYDLIYFKFKNYMDEASKIHGFIQEVHFDAKTILDVACGTGEHARILTENYGYHVDGIDIESEFIKIAQKKKVLLEAYQSNSEGAIVDKISRTKYDFLIINPAAYTHTSVAIRDALLAVARPTIATTVNAIGASSNSTWHRDTM